MEKHEMQYQTGHFNLNGKDVERTVDVRASLTDMLRNDFRMTSVKKGCEVGECGACNVLIDGEAFNSCIYLAVWAEGKRVRGAERYSGGLCGRGGDSVRLLYAGLYPDGGGDSGERQGLHGRRTAEASVRPSVPLYGLREHSPGGAEDHEPPSGKSVNKGRNRGQKFPFSVAWLKIY